MDYKERMNKMNEEEKKAYNEKKKAAAKAYNQRKKVAKELVKKWIAENPRGLTPEVKSAIEYLTGISKVAKSGVLDELRALFLEKKSISLLELFQKYEYGRPTMEQKVRQLIKLPEDRRIWIAFENGNYVLKGQGAEPPKGWTGYVPVVKEEL